MLTENKNLVLSSSFLHTFNVYELTDHQVWVEYTCKINLDERKYTYDISVLEVGSNINTVDVSNLLKATNKKVYRDIDIKVKIECEKLYYEFAQQPLS